ncbi:MAG: MotA/TolQ/ExbB proton channel family protein [Candidatus Omnitrophota bacterium]
MLSRVLRMLFLLLCAGLVFFIFWNNPLLRLAGPLMIPILLVSVLMFATVAGKFRQLGTSQLPSKDFLIQIDECLERQQIKEAIDLCERYPCAMARVFKAGLVKYDRAKDDIRESMDNALRYEAPDLEEGLVFLSSMTQIAPLLGLVGTLLGMVKILAMIQVKSMASLAIGVVDIAPGLWEALLCSIAGFLVAVPGMLAYNYLAARVDFLIEDIKKNATRLLNDLLDRRMAL